MRFDLSDDEWALLEPLMPKSRKRERADDRKAGLNVSKAFSAFFAPNNPENSPKSAPHNVCIKALQSHRSEPAFQVFRRPS